MPKTSYPVPARIIGRMLKTWREERGLSLRSVANASKAHHETITYDYLSRLENGQLMPSLPKLTSLASTYERPVSDLIDLYETQVLRRLIPKGKSYEMLRELGIKALDKGETTKAMALFLGALDAAKAKGADRQKLAVAHNNVAGAMIRAARYLPARQYLEEGLKLVESTHTRAQLFDNLAIVHYQLDNLPIAELYSREATALARGDEVLQPITKGTRAAVLLDLDRLSEAESLLRETVVLYRKAGKEHSEIHHLYRLGNCLVEQGKIDEGLSQLRTAAARAAERGDPDLRTKSLYFYGRCLFKAGRKEDAGTPLRSALRLATENDLRNEVFHAAYYLWVLAREIGAEEDAEEYFEIARRHRTRLQQRSEEAEVFDSLVEQPAAKRRRGVAAPKGAGRLPAAV